MSKTTGLQEEVLVQDQVVQATRIFLGVAIGFGFIASALGFLFFPSDEPVGGSNEPSSSPLLVAQVVSVKSLLDRDQQFTPMIYSTNGYQFYRQTSVTDGTSINTLQTNRDLQVAVADTPTNSNSGATPFSIETIPPVGAPAQMSVVEYKLAGETASTPNHKITVCIGGTSATHFFVGVDGTTYFTSSAGVLTNPTVSEPCADIVARAMRPTQITGGQMVASATSWPTDQTYLFTRGLSSTMATLDPINDFQAGVGVANADDGYPLAAVGRVNAGTTEEDLPASMVKLVQQETGGSLTTMTICMPSMVMLENSVTPITYYFDKDGTAFSDIFLSQLVVDYGQGFTTCPAAQVRDLHYSNITAASLVIQKPTDLSLNISRNGFLLGGFNGIIYNGVGALPKTLEMGAPIVVDPSTNLTTPVAYPESFMTLTGVDGTDPVIFSPSHTTTLCIPATTWTATDPNPPRYFYDAEGTPYKDIFLVNMAMDVSCPSILSKAYAPAHIASATMTPPINPDQGIGLYSGSYLYGAIDTTGWKDRQGQQGTFQKLPLALVLSGTNTAINLPKIQVAINDGGVTLKKLCWGGWSNVKPIDRTAAVFYDNQGNGYTDLFLSQPYTCPATTLFMNVKVVPTSNSAVITWDTDVPTCGRINYGTVSGVLNSGPVGDACSSTKPNGAPFTVGHKVTLTNLSQNKKYFYEIVGVSDGSGQQTFTTPAASTNSTTKKTTTTKSGQ